MTKKELFEKLLGKFADVPDDAEVMLERFDSVEFECGYVNYDVDTNTLWISGDY